MPAVCATGEAVPESGGMRTVQRRNPANGETNRSDPLFGDRSGAGLDDRLGRVFCRAVGGVCLCVAARRLGLGPRGPPSGHARGNRGHDDETAARRSANHERASIHDRLNASFRPWLVAHDFEAIDPWIEVKPTGCPRSAATARRARPGVQHAALHHGGGLFRAGREEGGPGRLAAAPGIDLPSFEHDAPASAGVEGAAAALAGRSSRASCPRSPA